MMLFPNNWEIGIVYASCGSVEVNSLWPYARPYGPCPHAIIEPKVMCELNIRPLSWGKNLRKNMGQFNNYPIQRAQTYS